VDMHEARTIAESHRAKRAPTIRAAMICRNRIVVEESSS
jgi:hypothetical protein